MFLQGAQEPLYSNEGTTQGDPLSMLFYGMALMPLIRKIRDNSKYTQSFYADDGAACGDLNELAFWLQKVCHEGPKYGYFPEPSKSI